MVVKDIVSRVPSVARKAQASRRPKRAPEARAGGQRDKPSMDRWCSLVNTSPCHGEDQGFKSPTIRHAKTSYVGVFLILERLDDQTLFQYDSSDLTIWPKVFR